MKNTVETIKARKHEIELLEEMATTVLKTLHERMEWSMNAVYNENGPVCDDDGCIVYTEPDTDDYRYNTYKAYKVAISVLDEYINKKLK